MKTLSKGFSMVEVLLVVAVVALIGGLGYVYVTNMNKSNQASSTQKASVEKPAVTTIKSSSDIDKATSELDSLDVTDSSDASTLNNSTSGL
jgi:prepilin-type N-terminal cleavage/methylation domain-containing protein